MPWAQGMHRRAVRRSTVPAGAGGLAVVDDRQRRPGDRSCGPECARRSPSRGSVTCDSPDIDRACWGCVRVVTTGSRRVVTTLSVGAAGCCRAPPRLQQGAMPAVARDLPPSWGRQRTPGWSARLGQGMSAEPISDAYLQALRPPGCRRSGRLGRPPKRTGRCGDGHQAG